MIHTASRAAIKKLAESGQPMQTCRWRDVTSGLTHYTVLAKAGSRWLHLADDGTPVQFVNEAKAEAEIRRLREPSRKPLA